MEGNLDNGRKLGEKRFAKKIVFLWKIESQKPCYQCSKLQDRWVVFVRDADICMRRKYFNQVPHNQCSSIGKIRKSLGISVKGILLNLKTYLPIVEMQTTYEEYKEWTEDGTVEDAVQGSYDKAKQKAETLMVFEDQLVTPSNCRYLNQLLQVLNVTVTVGSVISVC